MRKLETLWGKADRAEAGADFLLAHLLVCSVQLGAWVSEGDGLAVLQTMELSPDQMSLVV